MAQTIEGFVGTSLDDASMSPIHWRVFALISAGYFFDVCDYVILGALIPDMVRSGFATPASNRQIAEELFLSLDAVKMHLTRLFSKFELGEIPQNEKRARLAERALQFGVISQRDLT